MIGIKRIKRREEKSQKQERERERRTLFFPTEISERRPCSPALNLDPNLSSASPINRYFFFTFKYIDIDLSVGPIKHYASVYPRHAVLDQSQIAT